MKKYGFLFTVQLAVSAVALLFVVRRLGGIAGFGVSFTPYSLPWLAVCFLAALAAHAIGIWRWQILANALLPFPRLFSFYLRYYLIGLFYGTFVPGGQLVGEGVKIALMMPETSARSMLVSSIVADRLIGVAANGMLLIGLFLGRIYIQQSPASGIIFFSGLAITIGMGALCAVLFLFRRYAVNSAPLSRRGVKVYLTHFWGKMCESANAFLEKKSALVASLIGAFAFHIAAGWILYLAIRAMGARVDFFFVVWIYLIASIALILPISYAGFGIREGVVVPLLVFAGIIGAQALVISLLFFAVQAVFALAGGIYEIRELRNGLRRS